MSIPLLCIALLALLGIGLGFAVSMGRAKSQTMYGYPTEPDDSLYQLIRAHGNTMEYVPILALMIYILSLGPVAPWVMWCIVLVTVFRYLFVVGLIFPSTMAKPNVMRFVGALGTYLAGFGLCIALLLRAMNAG